MKKFLSFFLTAVLALTLTSCVSQKGIKVTLESDKYEGITADFFYPEDSDIEVAGDEFYSNWKTLTSQSGNYQLSLSLFENSTFNENKTYAKGDEDTYSEFKIGKFDAYGYEAFGGYYIYVHLEELPDDEDRYIVIEANRADFSADGLMGAAAYEKNDTVKSIVNSLVYNNQK